MDVNPDFRDLLRLFNDAGSRYLVVGAHAVAYHAEPRYTKDLDLWVEPSPANAHRVFEALTRFGAPLNGVNSDLFADPDMVYQIGIEPNRIDVVMGMEALTFATAWRRRVRSSYGGVPVSILSKTDLIRNKCAVARAQDLLDVGRLRSRPRSRVKKRRRKRT